MSQQSQQSQRLQELQAATLGHIVIVNVQQGLPTSREPQPLRAAAPFGELCMSST
jgi:hypothetical protein